MKTRTQCLEVMQKEREEEGDLEEKKKESQNQRERECETDRQTDRLRAASRGNTVITQQ